MKIQPENSVEKQLYWRLKIKQKTKNSTENSAERQLYRELKQS